MEVFALFLWSVGLINAATQPPVPQYYSGGAQYAYPVAAQPGWVVAAPPVLPVYQTEAVPVPRRDSSAAKAFGEHWQNFMEPSVSRPAAPAAGFGSGPRG